MAKLQSLDELIGKKAAEFAEQVRHAAAMADKEEEIRIEVERQLAFLEKETGVRLEGKHEFTVAKGRIDSFYTRVLIEYKNPSSPGDRLGPRLDSPGSKKVVEQIKTRFRALKNDLGQPLNALFGVGCDGKHFIFVRFRDEKWQVEEPVEVNKVSTERFLWALYNLGEKGKPFQPEYLAGDFGGMEGSIATEGIHALYDAIATTDHPKAQTFFQQWKILFGEVYGYDVDNPSDRIKKLAEFYGLKAKGLKPAELLFALHTYYALFMKLLASEIVAFFHKLPTPLKAMLSAVTSAKLKREMEELEAGSIFRHLNITNFLEGDLFAWYTAVWTEPIERLVRRMVAKLDDYNPGTMSEDPATSRDLLKKLYQQLFPKSVRHDLGEYYTPDWLAEHVLNELGYTGDPDKRLLDPACGSGTFLVMAINRIKRWYENNRERCAYEQGDLCRKILGNVIGFDLNPLAVMAARTNYLIAIRDLVGYVDQVEIPIYLCDSIMTPSEYGLFAGTSLGEAKELKTAAASFVVPTEIATRSQDVALYAEQLEFCVKNGFTSREFLQRCRDEGLAITTDSLHSDLFQELVKLDKANKNSVWARIIKNAFAPLFIGRVDYVAGNPPWISFDNLPAGYRETIDPLWDKYKLRNPSTWRGRFAKGNQDFSILFTYSCSDNYLNPAGKLGFVITQSVFQAVHHGSLDPDQDFGFRRLILGDRFFAVDTVCDFTSMQPFEGAVNRTSTVCLSFGTSPQTYPLAYRKYYWTKTDEDLSGLVSLEEFLSSARKTNWKAIPLRCSTGPWVIVPDDCPVSFIKRLSSGLPVYRAWRGTDTRGANGIFWMSVLKRGKGSVLIRNYTKGSKKKVEEVEASVEPDLLHSLIRGKDVKKWDCRTEIFVLHPHEGDKVIPESKMKTSFPKTFAYLRRFREHLSTRKMFDLAFRKSEFYALFKTHKELHAPYKVVWREVSQRLSRQSEISMPRF
jgi:hypothetical protein